MILSASDTVFDENGNRIQNGGLGGAVGYETSTKWGEETEVAIYGLKNVNEEQRNKSVEYAKSKVGCTNFNFVDRVFKTNIVKTILFKKVKIYIGDTGWWPFMVPYVVDRKVITEYIVPANKNNEDHWYCSKLVYKSWLSQNVNIEYSGGRQSEFKPDNEVAAQLVGLITENETLDYGWGDYEFVTPQNIADSEKDGTVYFKDNFIRND